MQMQMIKVSTFNWNKTFVDDFLHNPYTISNCKSLQSKDWDIVSLVNGKWSGKKGTISLKRKKLGGMVKVGLPLGEKEKQKNDIEKTISSRKVNNRKKDRKLLVKIQLKFRCAETS